MVSRGTATRLERDLAEEAEIAAIRREAEESLKALEDGQVVDGRTVLAEMRARIDASRRE